MTTNRKNITDVLEGRKPEFIPFSIYGWSAMGDDPAWQNVVKQGLCRVMRIPVINEILSSNVEKMHHEEIVDGKPMQRITLRTPLGELNQVLIKNHEQEYYLKTPDDYKIMKYIIENTKLELDSKLFDETEKMLGDTGFTLIYGIRSPMQTMIVDYAGLENFSYSLADGFPELFELADVLLEQLITYCKIAAKGPGRYFQLRENLTSDQWGPERFSKYHMPVYEKIIPILHSGGKKVYTHYDGKLSCLSKLISKTEIDGIDSLTAPPEGDMTLKEARAAFPGKMFWVNINISLYSLPLEKLKEKITEFVYQTSEDGRNLAFEISEDVPANWQESIPVVLDTLKNLKLV